MSQNMRNQPGDSQGSSGRGSKDTQERKDYEGFEGMNYEQRRQPYNPQHITNNRSGNGDGNSERHDEFN
jgi:hypothetical protein